MKWLAVFALLLASVASAKGGRFPLSGLEQPQTAGNTDPFIRCSSLSDPAFSVTSLTQATSANDLHEDIMAACGSGCIVEIGPGTYVENIVFGDTALKVDSVTPSGEVLIRAADPDNPPLIRAEVDIPAAVIHAKNVTARIRVEDVILDGRRSEQTAAGVTTVCTDTTPADDICDGNQSSTFLHGFDTRHTTDGSVTQSCLLRVEVRETVGTAFQMTDAFASVIEDSVVDGAGCTTALCPLMDIPANRDSTAVLKTAQGIQFVGGSDSAAIDNTVSDVTKIGIECFTNARRCHVHGNTITGSGIAGIVLNEADGTVKDNTISDIGFIFSPNSASNNVGQGIQFTNGDTYTGLVASITGNRITNTFGSGIQIGLAGTAYNTARVEVSRNSVTGTCNGGTRADSAGIEFGDSTYDIAQIIAEDNSTGETDCIDGIRVRNVRTHRNFRNGLIGGLDIDDVDEFDGRSLAITGDLDVDADTKGRIRTCTVTGSVIGAAALQRQDCGAETPVTHSSEWGTMVWTVDDWG